MSRLKPILFTLCLVACGHADQAVQADAEEDDDFKGCPAEIPAFAAGLRASSEHFSLKLLAATPSQPERYLDNDWTVELSGADGAPAGDATITRGQTFMPIHGHDGRVTPDLSALSVPGQFKVSRLNFSMRGPWEVRLWLRSTAVAEELSVFHVCVAQ